MLQSPCSNISGMFTLKYLSSGCIKMRPLLLFTAAAILFLSVSAVSAQEEEEENDGPDPIAIFNEAQDHHEKGALEEAIRLYKKAIEIAPEFPEAELQMGNAYLSLKRHDEAEAAFRNALEHREEWTLAMSALGSLLVQKGNYNEAEPLLARSLELEPLNFPAWVGMTYLRLRTDAPKETLNKLLADIKALTAKAKADPQYGQLAAHWNTGSAISCPQRTALTVHWQ